jgi:hypothetical protein
MGLVAVRQSPEIELPQALNPPKHSPCASAAHKPSHSSAQQTKSTAHTLSQHSVFVHPGVGFGSSQTPVPGQASNPQEMRKLPLPASLKEKVPIRMRKDSNLWA